MPHDPDPTAPEGESPASTCRAPRGKIRTGEGQTANAHTVSVLSWLAALLFGVSWAAALPLRLLVSFYQRLVSPLLPPSCRYYPSCSQYAADALRVHGALYGTWLSARRLFRCHPWCAGGFDPVPRRGLAALAAPSSHFEPAVREADRSRVP